MHWSKKLSKKVIHWSVCGIALFLTLTCKLSGVIQVSLNSRRVVWVVLALLLIIVVLRVYFHFSLHNNFYFGTYNVHHIFIGLLLITFAALPLVLFQGNSQKFNAVAMAFGAGLSLVLNPDA